MIITDIRVINGVVRRLNKIARDQDIKYKILRVGEATWANVLTKKPEKVKNIHFLGTPSCRRPYIITSIAVTDKNTNYRTVYKFTNMYYHANILNENYNYTFDFKGDGKKFPTNAHLEIYGEEFCNPITLDHIYSGDDTDIACLLRTTLMSQNLDDGYGSNPSVSNSETDLAVETSIGEKILPDASPIELICCCKSEQLRNMAPNVFNDRLRYMTNIAEDSCFVKFKFNSYYEACSKSYAENHKSEISSIYPIFTYEQIQKMNIHIPRDSYDLGVYGLGSAGTAILDQLARSNWIENIYLCDFDMVEAKNMINQWYLNSSINRNKTNACANLLKIMQRPMDSGISTVFHITTDTSKFQETSLDTKEFKYVVSGFDSIEVRQEFFNNIMDGKIKAKYLIDCRYLDLSCSVYFIDTDDTEQMEFYKANLDADGELIKNKKAETLTAEEFDAWVQRKGYYERNCIKFKRDDLGCEEHCRGSLLCGGDACKKYLYDLYLKSCPNNKISIADASCLKYNYIDIYKYVGAIVFSAIREIENGKEKPFCLIEATTEGLPNYMKVR